MQDMTLHKKYSSFNIVPNRPYVVNEGALGVFFIIINHLNIAYQLCGHKSELSCKLANRLLVNTPWVAQHIPLPNYPTIHKELMASSLCFYI